MIQELTGSIPQAPADQKPWGPCVCCPLKSHLILYLQADRHEATPALTLSLQSKTNSKPF